MKTASLQYGRRWIEIRVPASARVLSSGAVEPLADPAGQVRRSLDRPIASPPLGKLAQGRATAAVVVSDNTRPVPYKGPQGILRPIIETLKKSGVGKTTIIVACGTHRPMEEPELRNMLDESAFQPGVEVVNHVAMDESMLRSIGRTDRTPNVTVNRHYLDAELKIATGLVEPHFMAGFSGGRKAICPGICGQEVLYGFHSASILDDPGATSLVLDGNPCHEEALRVAGMAGVDFIVNATLDSDKRLTGVFAGELEAAHLAAVEHLRSYVTIPLDRLYDVVITQAGEVGLNHYQCAKAAIEAVRAVKPGGSIVLVADLVDPDPVGSRNYKDLLGLLARIGPDAFVRKILTDGWRFVPEQWEVQMWAKAFQRLGSADGLHTCATQLASCPDGLIPGVNVAARNERLAGECDIDYARRITQLTIDRLTKDVPDGQVLVLPDGPYSVPVRKGFS